MTELYVDGLHLISNPYVLRLDFQDIPLDEIYKEHRRIIKLTRKVVSETTWGYSPVQYDLLNTHAAHEFKNRVCAYWAFESEPDALIFRLQCDKTTHVVMWPKNITFTVYRVT